MRDVTDAPTMTERYKEKEVAQVTVESVEEKNELDAPGLEIIHLHRRFSLMSCLGMGFAILNSWTAMASALQIVLPSGGSIAMVWGIVVSSIGAALVAASMAEICQVYPLTGGQYDWAYVLAPEKIRRPLSFFAGWMSCSGWIALIAGGASICANFMISIVNLSHPDFEVQRWHIFLLYLAWTLCAFLLNMFCVKVLPAIERAAFYWSLTGLAIIVITCLACSSGQFQPAEMVFTHWTNDTGWPDGMAFILGLLQSVFGLTAFDAVTHMIEEMPNPGKNAPRVMMTSIALGSSTSWIFTIVLLFCMRNLDDVLAAGTGPLIEIYYQATSNIAGATCLVAINLVVMFAACQAVLTVGSRLIFTFARDRGLGALSPFLDQIHGRLLVPVWSIVFCSTCVVIFGFIYLGSNTALNAIVSASIVLLQISYSVPVILILIRGPKVFAGGESHLGWSLGRFRRLVNGCAVAYLVVTSVCFLLPPFLPVSGSNMNYVPVVLAVVLCMCLVTWLIDGRKNYAGPSRLQERLEEARRA